MPRSSGVATVSAEDEGKLRFRQLVQDALNIADQSNFSPEIGAKLQEVIDLADELLGT